MMQTINLAEKLGQFSDHWSPKIIGDVNGTLVNEGFDAYPTYGRIQLQTELAEVFIRRLELWPLGKGPKPARPDDRQ